MLAKKYTLFFTLSLLVFITGCSDKTQEESTKKETLTTPKIEVVANKDPREIKVKEKDIDINQSKSYYYDYNIKSAYDENEKPANEDASVRVKPKTHLDANIHIRSPYEEVQVSMIANKLSKNFIVKCSACHNDYANGVIGPSLLDKDSDYIFNAIAEFKSAKKTNVLMNDLIKMMSDKEIRELADEIYTFNKAIRNMRK
ncbi:hypothetical protein KJ877_06710 [bacterium]|nr:hypothetical protein [bacterium]MBU1991333.1 hypothetical protein [bacterium]